MKNAYSRIAAAILASAVFVGGAAAFAADAAKPAMKGTGPQGDTIDSIKQLPDWTGVWEPLDLPKGADEYKMKPALTPAWSKRFDEIKAMTAAKKKVPSRNADCITRGVPGGMWDNETLLEFYFTPKRVTMVDTSGWVRRIYTDGRDHEDLVDTFQGDSIGHWENGTLVVHTEALDLNNEFIVGLNQGVDSKVSERVHLKDPNTLQIDTVLEAPKALSQPLKRTVSYKRHKDWMMTEYDCVFDNLDTNRAIVR